MDRRAYQEGPAFLLERSYSNLVGALKQTPLTIIDHRLSSTQSPVIDLRSAGAAILPPAPAGTSPATAPAGTSPGASPSGAPAARPAARPPSGAGAPSLTPQIEDAN
jgi:hypothetical protein